MTRKQQRLAMLGLGMAALGGATALVLTAFSSNLVFFYSPSDLKTRVVMPDTRVRIGGLVEDGSVTRGAGGRVSFRITDGKADIRVSYRGILPDLFRQGQGVVAEGELEPDGSFAASTVLAKHDARYMPRNVVDALKKSGHWQEGAATPGAARPLDAAAAVRASP
ncbi:MAG TPA: cytochrome c maturation protein CcmE [Stellaceae bacterium]|jgi:cytochrome c-type biogenesis protein CcmE|nr:cytochrome c maturation protein CcmE [Stellaceae bacterium]